jgi:hypothetical protein
MDSGVGTSADNTQHAHLPVCVRKGGKASRSLAAAAAKAAHTKCARASRVRDTKARRGGGAAAPAVRGPPGGHPRRRDRPPPPRRGPREAALRLPAVRGAPRRASTAGFRRPCPCSCCPTFASFCPEGTLTGARRRVPLPEREIAGRLAPSAAWGRSRGGSWA